MSHPRLRRASNGIFYVHWADRRRSKRFSTGERDPARAKQVLGRFLLGLDRREPRLQRRKTRAVRCSVAWAHYFEGHVLPKTMAPQTAAYVWKNLEQHFGPLAVDAITQATVDAYRQKREAGRIGRPAKPSTVRRELATLRACLSWCADPKRRLVLANQKPAFDLPDDGAPRDRCLSAPEVRRLLSAAAEHRTNGRLSRVERFVWIALETAARKSALLELTWDRVDFETKVIHLNVPGRRLTKKRRADVPISSALLPLLERMKAERLCNFVLDSPAEIWPAIQRACRRAGLGEPLIAVHSRGAKPKRTGISPNVLRHTAATNMARRGVPLWKIAKVMGNSVAIVERVYAKHAPDDLRDAVEAINEGWAISSAPDGA